jgi:hypothetical protein
VGFSQHSVARTKIAARRKSNGEHAARILRTQTQANAALPIVILFPQSSLCFEYLPLPPTHIFQPVSAPINFSSHLRMLSEMKMRLENATRSPSFPQQTCYELVIEY